MKSEGKGKFVHYFEKCKHLSFKNKLRKSARNREHLSDDYWDGVTTAASNDDKVRTVKNINSSSPLMVASKKKNRNILQCKCKGYTWYNLCFHTVAVECDTGISFDFFSEIKKKINLKGKKRGLPNFLYSEVATGGVL